jgi:nicotinamidase-related amidase
MRNAFSLIDASDCVLLIIDVQEYFLGKLETEAAQRICQRIRWLAQVAGWLKIPVIVTAEDMESNDTTVAMIGDVLPDGRRALNKMVFSLTGQPEILAAVQDTKRNTTVLVGLETDVCVQHSALGLVECGYRVAVVVDATGSPQSGHEIGIRRMASAGVLLVSCKSLFYEWLPSLDSTRRFARESGIIAPADLYLG